jgi:hypothetical protein
MSLKFGIYLVEQRIISPEQFCGLVKIQQESASSLPTIAIRRNLMTIKQVARVLTAMERDPAKSFIDTALEEHIVDKSDVERLIHEQLDSCPPLRKLLVECGLLTHQQTEVLFNHFEKQMAAGMKAQLPLPSATLPKPTTASPADPSFSPPQPKFSQRPVVAKSYSSALPPQ